MCTLALHNSKKMDYNLLKVSYIQFIYTLLNNVLSKSDPWLDGCIDMVEGKEGKSFLKGNLKDIGFCSSNQ